MKNSTLENSARILIVVMACLLACSAAGLMIGIICNIPAPVSKQDQLIRMFTWSTPAVLLYFLAMTMILVNRLLFGAQAIGNGALTFLIYASLPVLLLVPWGTTVAAPSIVWLLLLKRGINKVTLDARNGVAH